MPSDEEELLRTTDPFRNELKFIWKNLDEIKTVMGKLADSMADLARQDEKIIGVCQRLDNVEKGQEAIFNRLHDIETECGQRVQYVAWAKREIEKQAGITGGSPFPSEKIVDSVFDKKVAGISMKVVWVAVSASIIIVVQCFWNWFIRRPPGGS